MVTNERTAKDIQEFLRPLVLDIIKTVTEGATAKKADVFNYNDTEWATTPNNLLSWIKINKETHQREWNSLEAAVGEANTLEIVYWTNNPAIYTVLVDGADFYCGSSNMTVVKVPKTTKLIVKREGTELTRIA